MPSRRGLIILFLFLLMEILAGFAVIVGSGLLEATSLGYGMFWVLMAVGLLGVASALLIGWLAPRAPWNRVAMLAAGALVTGGAAFLVSSGLVAFLASATVSALAYWRGLAVTQEPPTHDEVQLRFNYGFGVLFLGIIWVVARGIIFQHPVWHMLAFVGIAYTITAMVALGAARVEEIREAGAGQAVAIAIAVELGLLLVLSLAAIDLFTLDIAGWFGHLTAPLWNALGQVVAAVLSVVLAPLAWLVDHLRVHAHQPRHLTAPVNPATGPGRKRKLKAQAPDNFLIFIIGSVVTLIIFAGIAYLIVRTLPHIPRFTRERGFTEERQSLWSFDAFRRALLAWLRALFQRGAVAAESAVSAARLRVLGPEYPADPIRRVYAQALRRAQSNGLVRPPAATPAEFQAALAARWPEGTSDFAALTDAYTRRRYGDQAVSAEETERVRASWHHLRGLMRFRTMQAPESEARAETAGEVAIQPAAPLPRQLLHRLAGIAKDPSVQEISADLVSAVLAVVILLAFVVALVVFISVGR